MSHLRITFPRKLKKFPVNSSKNQTTCEMFQSKETSHCEIPLSSLSLRNSTLLTGFLHNCKHAKRNSNNTDSIPFKPGFRIEHSNISETFCRRFVFISSFQKKDLIRLQTIWFLLSQRIKERQLLSRQQFDMVSSLKKLHLSFPCLTRICIFIYCHFSLRLLDIVVRHG